jgi:hypothetical protein
VKNIFLTKDTIIEGALLKKWQIWKCSGAFVTDASQNGACITQRKFHVIILFQDCSMINDELSNEFLRFNKKMYWFSHEEKAVRNISVL